MWPQKCEKSLVVMPLIKIEALQMVLQAKYHVELQLWLCSSQTHHHYSFSHKLPVPLVLQ